MPLPYFICLSSSVVIQPPSPFPLLQMVLVLLVLILIMVPMFKVLFIIITILNF